MTTLTLLKSTIADDIDRTDLTSQIAAAINSAIAFYATKRFYFNETRSSTFVTVAAQSRYTSSDDTDIPKFVSLDRMFLIDTGSLVYELEQIDPLEMELLLDSGASSSRPNCFSWYERTFAFHPIPDGIYTIRPLGIIQKDAPATDDEENNIWMTDGFELIRSAAKRYLTMHVINDPDLMQRASQAEGMARDQLKSDRYMATGNIVPTVF